MFRAARFISPIPATRSGPWARRRKANARSMRSPRRLPTPWPTRPGYAFPTSRCRRPAFIKQRVRPPAPPSQVDWVILQRFANNGAALAWLRSDERQRLVAEAQPILVGQDDVHLVADSQSGVLPAPASAVLSTRIKPGQPEAYRRGERK